MFIFEKENRNHLVKNMTAKTQITKKKGSELQNALPLTGCENENLRRKKMAFFEIVVLFSTYLCQHPHKKSKYLVKGIKSYSHLKNFSLLNYKESSFHGLKIPSSKLTETLGLKGVTFDSLDHIF